MRTPIVAVWCSCLALSTSCSVQTITYPPGTTEPLFSGLGDHHVSVTTDSHLAQRYFDQGRMMRYAFAYEASRRAFDQAATLDPDCAMAWWGVAWSRGPHFWSPAVSEENARRAWHAVERARAACDGASAREQALVEAVAQWFAPDPVADRSTHNRAYADAMAKLWSAYPDDAEIGTIYVQALIALRYRGLWTRDAYQRNDTKRIVAVLEHILAIDPLHPGANHFLIHAVEASPHFRRGLVAANRLETLAPGAPHLVHMVSHIDVRTGNWSRAIEVNQRAGALTRSYLERGLDALVYSPAWTHNYHMMAFACMMGGRYADGVAAGRAIEAAVVKDKVATRSFDRWRVPILYEVHNRFGRWHATLGEPEPPDGLPFVKIMWHFARAVAFAALGEIKAAEHEHTAFRDKVAVYKPDANIYRDTTSEIFTLAELVMQGEIAFHRGDTEEAVRLLRAAVSHEDGLKYYEPPLWHQPARHALGAVLVTLGRHAEAEAVYRADLRLWPHNGWSLHGLEICLRTRGAHDEADLVKAEFDRAWTDADTSIAASCLCVLRR